MLFKRPVSFCVILVRSGCVAPELLRMRRLNQATDWSKLSVPVHKGSSTEWKRRDLLHLTFCLPKFGPVTNGRKNDTSYNVQKQQHITLGTAVQYWFIALSLTRVIKPVRLAIANYFDAISEIGIWNTKQFVVNIWMVMEETIATAKSWWVKCR